MGRGLTLPKGWKKAVPNIVTSLKYEIAAFAENINFIHSRQDGFFSPGILFVKRILYPLDNNIRGPATKIFHTMSKSSHLVLPVWPKLIQTFGRVG